MSSKTNEGRVSGAVRTEEDDFGVSLYVEATVDHLVDCAETWISCVTDYGEDRRDRYLMPFGFVNGEVTGSIPAAEAFESVTDPGVVNLRDETETVVALIVFEDDEDYDVVEFDSLSDALDSTCSSEYVPTVEAVRGDGTVVRSFWWKTVDAAMAAVDEVDIASEGLGDWTVYPAIVAYPGGSADGEEEVADEAAYLAYLRGEVEVQDEPDDDLGPEVDDEGGMSEFRNDDQGAF